MKKALIILSFAAAIAALAHYFALYWITLIGFGLLVPIVVWGGIEWKMQTRKFNEKIRASNENANKHLNSANQLISERDKLKDSNHRAYISLIEKDGKLTLLKQELNRHLHKIKTLEIYKQLSDDSKNTIETQKREIVNLNKKLSEVNEQGARLDHENRRLMRALEDRELLQARLEQLKIELRERDNWMPFALSDEEFSCAVAQIFR